ncbi:hypothetical protein V5N11_018585 [Cardamine amara subsp. amara]|uniref:Uncharacterized protein n=1 Tax=Cardamine amara subsp. amara TaxID=228776 RepID=A0ABD0Z8K6_CARAN
MHDLINYIFLHILDIYFDTQIADPEDLPDALNNLKWRTFQMIVSVEKENLWSGLDTYKVLKVLSKNGMITEQHAQDDSDNNVHSMSIISGDHASLRIPGSQDEKEDTTPSSKRQLDVHGQCSDQSSTTKRLHLETVDLDTLEDEKIPTGFSPVEIKNDDATDDKKFKDIKIKTVTVKIEPKDR